MMARGRKLSTIQNAVRNVYSFAESFEGGPLHEMTGRQAEATLVRLRQRLKPRTIEQVATWVKAYVRWSHDGELPRDVAAALKVSAPRGTNRRPILDAEFRALLQAAAEHPDAIRATQLQALLWLLWDTGFRVNELMSVRLCDWMPDSDSATISLPQDAPGLKTGPRTITVVESAPIVNSWIRLHPERNDPEARLMPLHVGGVSKALDRLAERARVRHVHPHLFRHTRATRAARASWTEHHMNQYFGWAPGSRESATYVHLYREDTAQLVRRDAKIDPLGALIREDPMKALSAAIAAALKAAKDDRDDPPAAPTARS